MISDLAFTSLVSFISLLHYHLSLILTLSVYEVEKLKYIVFFQLSTLCVVEMLKNIGYFHNSTSHLLSHGY